MVDKKVNTASKQKLQYKNLDERNKFRQLLLSNPNYFGNMPDLDLKPGLVISGSTFYEELAAVGYHSQNKRLEAVVYIYRSQGYGTDLCGPGTREYVRFFISYDDGATWEDQGLTSFQVYNIPGVEAIKRLEYAASISIDPKKKFCISNPLIKVRAILSWENPPTANDPDFHVAWGNVLEKTILIEPYRIFFLKDVLKAVDIKVSSALDNIIGPEVEINSVQKKYSVEELSKIYKDKVPVHRFAFEQLSGALLPSKTFDPKFIMKMLPDFNFAKEAFVWPKSDGDISYEELMSIGLNPNMPDTLVGIIKVKLSAGYSGSPCSTGSKEYVIFWGDFDGNGTFEKYLGTASVSVYDIADIPGDGIYYAVYLPVDLNPYRQNCKEGAKNIRIRAILSWASLPPDDNPNYVPVWGNREETVINISPKVMGPAGKIAILGGIPVSHIDGVSGLTKSTAFFATNNLAPDSLGRECPFGGRVTVQGAPIEGGPHSYKIEVSPAGGGAPVQVVTSLWLTRADGTTYQHTANLATQRFDYVPFTENINSVLAQWDTSGDDKWIVKLLTYAGDSSNLAAIWIGLDTHTIKLDNTYPEAALNITSGAGNCGKFSKGDLIKGNFVARDEYLGSWGIGVHPSVNPAGVGVPNPNSGLTNTPTAPGSTWDLDTTNMKPCGYLVYVSVVDRAIINSQAVGHYASANAGFCLEEKK